jgi:hypothetical protein
MGDFVAATSGDPSESKSKRTDDVWRYMIGR